MRPGSDWPAVAAAVRVRMAELSITAADLARETGLSPGTIARARHGAGASREATLTALSEGLGWPPGHLRGIAQGEPGEPHQLSTLISGLPEFQQGTRLQGELLDLSRRVARDLSADLTEAQRTATARFLAQVSIKMHSPTLRH